MAVELIEVHYKAGGKTFRALIPKEANVRGMRLGLKQGDVRKPVPPANVLVFQDNVSLPAGTPVVGPEICYDVGTGIPHCW